MPKFILAYHGGTMPETPEDGEKMMAAWNKWYQDMGETLADGGAACGKSMTVNSDGSVTADGGSNPLNGYTVINARNHDAANEVAKGCPMLGSGGSVEVCELLDM